VWGSVWWWCGGDRRLGAGQAVPPSQVAGIPRRSQQTWCRYIAFLRDPSCMPVVVCGSKEEKNVEMVNILLTVARYQRQAAPAVGSCIAQCGVWRARGAARAPVIFPSHRSRRRSGSGTPEEGGVLVQNEG